MENSHNADDEGGLNRIIAAPSGSEDVTSDASMLQAEHVSRSLASRQSSPSQQTSLGARPSRNRERISYADFYKIGHKITDPVVSPVVADPKDRSSILKLKVKQAKGAVLPEKARTIINDEHTTRMMDARPLSNVGNENLDTTTYYAIEDDKTRLEGSRGSERLPTSPLSSILSDLGAEDDDTSTIGSNTANLVETDYKGRYSEPLTSSTFLAPGRKRTATIDANRGSDRKSRKNKKIKISSPAKHKKESLVELGVLPQDPRIKSKVETDARMRVKDDDQGSNDGHCSACQGTGKLLCCDDCPRSFHFSCIEPPIEEADIPDEAFFCMSCWDKRFGFTQPDRGIFHALMVNEMTRDPVMFLLPEHIRNFFSDVSTSELGTYQENKDQKILRKDRQGFAEEIDPHRLRDRHNQPILCYRCGESALDSVGIVSCDHCSSHWHFDCVEPPLHGAPSAYKKWMCPLHADDITPHSRQARDPKIVKTSMSRGFKNIGNIEVDLDDDAQATDSDSDSDIDDPMTWAPALADLPRVRYKLPSRGIILDFLDTCRQADEPHKELDFLDDIVPTKDRHSSLEALVDVALSNSNLIGIPTSSKQEEERLQILAIQALMKVKGKEKLLQFLEHSNTN